MGKVQQWGKADQHEQYFIPTKGVELVLAFHLALTLASYSDGV
jgi:hypothetical protein